MIKFWVFAAMLLAVPLGAAAQTGPFAPPTGFMLLSSHDRDPATGRPAVTNASTPDANTQISQWKAPGDFPPFSCGKQADATVCDTADAWSSVKTVKKTGGVFSVSLSQDGAAAPCRIPMGFPSELDLFIQPKGLAPAYAKTKDFPSLAQMTSFDESGVFTVDDAGPSPGPEVCPANHAGATLGLILVDDKVQPAQMFWYSVKLFGVCIPGKPSYANCAAGLATPRTVWVWTGTQGPGAHIEKDMMGDVRLVNFDVVDPPQAFGLQQAQVGQPETIKLDFLHRFTTLIGSGQYGIDPDPSHWRLAGVTQGQALWGGTKLATTWQGFWPEWTLAK
jgi:hypothetical protein